jgi:chemotaxis response regulator CheB
MDAPISEIGFFASHLYFVRDTPDEKTVSKLRVLIVEDVAEMRELLRECLKGAAGLEVSAACANTWEARLELERRKPDVILLDEVLPGESSQDFAAEAGKLGVRVLWISELSGREGCLKKPSWKTLRKDRTDLIAAVTSVTRRASDLN